MPLLLEKAVTPELIKQWAMEADFFKDGFDQWVAPTFATVEAFAALVAAHEREECAKVCESTTEYGALDEHGETKAYASAAAIRGTK